MNTVLTWLASLVVATALAAPIPVPKSPMTKSVGIPAGSWNVDATQCVTNTAHQINSGPITDTVVCADNDAGAVYFSTGSMPTSYTGGTVVIQLAAEHETASPSGNFVMQFSCQCGSTISGTWGTAQTATLAFTTQYQTVYGTTAAMTCAGTCARGATLWFRGLVSASGTTTGSIGSLQLEGAKLKYPADSFTDQ